MRFGARKQINQICTNQIWCVAAMSISRTNRNIREKRAKMFRRKTIHRFMRCVMQFNWHHRTPIHFLFYYSNWYITARCKLESIQVLFILSRTARKVSTKYNLFFFIIDDRYLSFIICWRHTDLNVINSKLAIVSLAIFCFFFSKTRHEFNSILE